MLKQKKLKVLAMILLTSTLLILTSAVSIPSVKAATTTTLVVYNTLGGASTGAVKANGTAMVQTSAGNSLITGDTYQFTATPASGYKFIGWAYADATGPSGTTSATFTKVISAACSLEAIFVPTTNVTATTSGSGASTLVPLRFRRRNNNSRCSLCRPLQWIFSQRHDRNAYNHYRDTRNRLHIPMLARTMLTKQRLHFVYP